MKDVLPTALARVRAGSRPVLHLIRANRIWAESGAVAFCALLAAFALGYSALARTSALEAQIAELERIEEGLDRWRAGLAPPDTAESASWRASDATLRRLAASSSQPLSVSRLVANRAEEVGIEGMSVRVVDAGDLDAPPPLRAGTWSAQAGPPVLEVQFDGPMSDVIAFLGALPPEAAVSNVRLVPKGGAYQANVRLLTRVVGADG